MRRNFIWKRPFPATSNYCRSAISRYQLESSALFIFFHVKENEPKENARVPRILRGVQPINEASPRAAMRRCQVCSGAHNLAIAARLASPGALPDNTILAASTA
jgi:hypothetical protein